MDEQSQNMQASENAPILHKEHKNKLWFIAIAVVILLTAGGIYWHYRKQQPTSQVQFTAVTQDEGQVKTMADANNYFGFNLYRDIEKKKPDTNLFVSPLSLSQALGMTANGASGTTLTEMQKVLGLSNLGLDNANQYSRTTLDSLKSSTVNSNPEIQSGDKPTSNIANSLWANKNSSFLPAFTDTVSKYYDGTSQSLDFANPQSLLTINQWVSDRTNAKITNALDDLSNADLLLIDAIYFKSSWEIPFDVSQTQNTSFKTENNGSKTIPMMSNQSSYTYAEDNGLQIVALPYLGNYSMVAFLPKQGTNIADVVSSMTFANYQDYIKKLSSQDGIVKLPKFNIQYSDTDILSDLTDLGMTTAGTSQADFSKMSDVPQMISAVIHKTFISTDEKGTEATASTVVKMMSTAVGPGSTPPPPFQFTADHPFFFTIQNNTDNSIIFMGTVNDPS